MSNENRYSLMSYNILCDKPKPERIERLIATIKNYMPDTIGMQEVTPYWLSFLKPALPNYECVGLGRDGGDKGEHSCVFFNTDKFELVKTETKWLTDTPDVVSVIPESAYIRIVTFAHLRRKSDGKEFVHTNTHIDYKPATFVPQVKFLKQYAEPYYAHPMFVTGDFNMYPTTDGYAEMVSSHFSDSSTVAENAEISHTFPACDEPYGTIDYCFVTADTISVKSYKVCKDKIDGDYGSDHFPVYIEYELK